MKRFAGTVLIIVLLLTVSTGIASAASYQTKRFDVSVDVGEDHSFKVTETITMEFLEDSHGIFRYIPYAGSIYFEQDGEAIEMPYRVKITDTDVPGFPFERSFENNNLLLKIGDPDRYVYGPITYRITYLVTAFDDRIDEMDQFYWGLMPTGWNTSVESASFRITMPKSFDESAVEFLSGRYGSTDTSAVDWTVRDTLIYGSTNRQLLKRWYRRETQPRELL